MKPLDRMSNEELWQLFPITVGEYNADWPAYYEAEKDSIISSVGADTIVKINHIGSTAVLGLAAKPTIDILLEIAEGTDLDALREKLEDSGYIFSAQPDKPAPHMMFMKGYTPQGFADRVFHLHIRYPGDWDELRFRDYLISHPDKAKRYGELKLRLMEEFRHDRDGYTKAKSGFIYECVRKARQP